MIKPGGKAILTAGPLDQCPVLVLVFFYGPLMNLPVVEKIHLAMDKVTSLLQVQRSILSQQITQNQSSALGRTAFPS